MDVAAPIDSPPAEIATEDPTSPPDPAATTRNEPLPLPPPRAHSFFDPFWLMPGALFTATTGKVPATGVGAELSLVYGLEDSPLFVGAFGQAQSYAGSYGRYAGGVEGGSLLGMELALDYREKHDGYAGTYGIHTGPYFSLGFVSVGFRMTIPVGRSGPGDSQGFECGVAATVKFPIADYEHNNFLRTVMHGRAPRGGEAYEQHGGHEALDGRAAFWLACAREELTSVATFLALAHDLAAAGAPSALVRAAQLAAHDELLHGRASLRVAAAFDPTILDRAWAWRVHAPLGASLSNMVHDAIIDGIHGEGVAAECMVRAAHAAGAGRLRDTMLQVASDEWRHAALARAVALWATTTRRVGLHVVTSALETLEKHREAGDGDPRYTTTELRLLAQRGRARDAGVDSAQSRKLIQRSRVEATRAILL